MTSRIAPGRSSKKSAFACCPPVHPTGNSTRPVEARLCRDEGRVYVVAAKERELERNRHVGLTFVDPTTNAYLAIAGYGAIITDGAKQAMVVPRPTCGGRDPTIRTSGFFGPTPNAVGAVRQRYKND